MSYFFVSTRSLTTLGRVPAADAKVSQEAMNETFLLSNIAPQVGAGFNRHCMSPLWLVVDMSC